MRIYYRTEFMNYNEIDTDTLSTNERTEIANNIRENIVENRIDDTIIEVRKLKIMLNLFEQYGREFQQYLPVPSMNHRALDIKLLNKHNQCSVVLRSIKC